MDVRGILGKPCRWPAVLAVLAVTVAAAVAFEWWFWSRPTGAAPQPARGDQWPERSVSLAESYHREGASPALLGRLLELQGDPELPFSHAWDAVLASAYASAGKMTDAQRQRYIRQTLGTPLKLEGSSPVRPGERPALTAVWAARGCMDGWLRYDLFLVIDGRAVADTGLVGGTESLNSGRLTADLGPCLAGDGPLPLGSHHLHVTLRRQAFDWHGQPRTPPVDVSADLDLAVTKVVPH